jgi:aminoglycoside phosphotransferase (APT) family kinase protein
MCLDVVGGSTRLGTKVAFSDGDAATDPHWQPGHGHRLPPYARTDLALRGAAELIRRLHSAAFGFQSAITCYRFHPDRPQAGQIVSHGDLGPCNTVYKDGIPAAFIDWDAAQPVAPLDDLAAAAWTFVPRRTSPAPRQDSTRPQTYQPGCAVLGRLRPNRPEGDPATAPTLRAGPARTTALAPEHLARAIARTMTRLRCAQWQNKQQCRTHSPDSLVPRKRSATGRIRHCSACRPRA